MGGWSSKAEQEAYTERVKKYNKKLEKTHAINLIKEWAVIAAIAGALAGIVHYGCKNEAPGEVGPQSTKSAGSSFKEAAGAMTCTVSPKLAKDLTTHPAEAGQVVTVAKGPDENCVVTLQPQ